MCITAYIVVMWIEFSPAFLEKFGMKDVKRKLNKLLFLIIALGTLLPSMHQSSLGSLLVVFGYQINPLWQTHAVAAAVPDDGAGDGFCRGDLRGMPVLLRLQASAGDAAAGQAVQGDAVDAGSLPGRALRRPGRARRDRQHVRVRASRR